MTTVLLYAIAVLLMVSITMMIVYRHQHRTPKVKPSGRWSECETCSTKIAGKNWWTLVHIHTDVDGETNGGGGSVTMADYCHRHRPRTIPTGSTLHHHG